MPWFDQRDQADGFPWLDPSHGLLSRHLPRCMYRRRQASGTVATSSMIAKTTKNPLSAPHGLPAGDVLAALDVSSTSGLSEAQATRRLQQHGPNSIGARKKVGAFAVLVHQFQSLVVALLAVAAGLAFYFREWEEGGAIVGVLALNTVIGFLTEIKAARSIEALRVLGTRSARVRRDGRTRLIPAERLVPGDIVLLDAGDVVTADLRLVEASNLEVDESPLTGESMGVGKTIAPVDVNARVSDRSSMLFKGTRITRGSGLGVVVATGMDSELGHISQLVEEAVPEASPLEKRLARLSGQLVWVTLILTAVIGGIGLAEGKDTFLMVEAAIALAIAAIPEGLPIVATLALARGMWRMARQNALIERLSAVETLGATTVILTDKTGTLTENRMTVRRVWLPSCDIDVGQTGFEASTRSRRDRPVQRLQLVKLLEVAVLCNNAALGRVSDEDNGDPMELALLRAGRLAGLERGELLNESPEVVEHAFDTSTNMMATVHRRGGVYLFAVKGAPEAVLAGAERLAGENSDAVMDEATRAKWLERVAELGGEGLRVLAFAALTRSVPDGPPFQFLDVPGSGRAGGPAAKRRSGCDTRMPASRNPGGHDHWRPRRDGPQHCARCRAWRAGRAWSRDAISPTSPRQSPERLLQTDIFARVSPDEKLQLVRAYQAAGEIVAVTGDGVNDAPALRQADIGVAMGLRGTDVAREAAAMILLNDAFPTIVAAIREGRVIFGNIRRFVAYLLSCNLCEVFTVGVAILFGLPLPLLPLQLLFLNLVTDVFPAFALAMGEGEADVLNRPPRDPKEPILGRARLAPYRSARGRADRRDFRRAGAGSSLARAG